MKKTFELGKIDYNGSGRRNCMVTVDLELRDSENGPELSICADIWNPSMTDIYTGGQCLDTIKNVLDIQYDADNVMKYFPNYPLFIELYRLHELYHLNGMHAGTKAQEVALKKAEISCSYAEACNYLMSIGLYEDNGYRYGSGWRYEEIPAEDLAKIKKLLED